MNCELELIEKELFAILKEIKKKLTKEEYYDVSDFLTHGEYGIAFENLCEILKEKGLMVPSSVYEKLLFLGKKMAMENSVKGVAVIR